MLISVGFPYQQNINGHSAFGPTAKAFNRTDLSADHHLGRIGRWLLGFLGGQRLLPLEFPPNDLFRPMAWGWLKWRCGCEQFLPGASFSQRPGILPNVHLTLHRQQHVNAPLQLATRDVFSIDKPAVQDESFDHSLTHLL